MNINTTEITAPAVNRWNRNDIAWALSLYGTAIGAGVLFLPINAGLGGLLPVIIMGIIAFPMTFLSHRNLSRFVLTGKNVDDDITDVSRQQFGNTTANVITGLYFFAIFPLLMIYGVSLTNNVLNIITNLMGFGAPSRAVTSLIITAGLLVAANFNRDIVIKIMSCLVFPLIACIVFFSFAMIPNWNMDTLNTLSFSYSSPLETHNTLFKSIWITLPVMIFGFYHLVIISSFTRANRQEYGEYAAKKTSKIIASAVTLMVITAMFFVFSCVMVLGPELLAEAKDQNISVLDYLAVYLHTPAIKYMAAGLVFAAIVTSFIGHYLGIEEGFKYFAKRAFNFTDKNIPETKIKTFAAIFMFFFIWYASYKNPSVLGTIERLEGPIISFLLFLFPLYAIYKISSLKKYRSFIPDLFILIIGLISVSVAFSNFF